MRLLFLCLFAIFTPLSLFPADQSHWTDWQPAKSAAHRNEQGINNADSQFVYRWRVSTACGKEDCVIHLQIRNNTEKRKYVNYSYSVETKSGSVDSEKDHRNFDPHEVQDIPVNVPGRSILEVRIDET